jgi:hypothetical protein
VLHKWAMDEEAHDNVVPLSPWRAADCLPNHACHACTEREVFTRDFLRVALTRAGRFRIAMTRGGPPIIGRILGEPTGFEQGLQLHKARILMPTKDGGHDLARGVIDRMPAPARVPCVPDTRPHLLHLGFVSTLTVPGHVGRVQRVSHGRVDGLQRPSFCMNARGTVLGQRGNERTVSRTPLALRRMAMSGGLISGTPPRLRSCSSKRRTARSVWWHRERWVPWAVVPRWTLCAL